MKRFCPKCGKTQGEPGAEHFINGFCKKCYLQDHDPLKLPEKIVIDKCKACGKIRVGRDWQQESHETILNQIRQKTKGNLTVKKQDLQMTEYDETKKQSIAYLKTHGVLNDTAITLENEVKVKRAMQTCPHCSKLAGGYYEAVLQIRFEKKPTKTQARKTLKKIDTLLKEERTHDPLAEIIKLVETKNGMDLQIGSKKAAKKIAEELARKHSNQKIKTSRALVTEKQDKKLYRTTYCIRIHEIQEKP